MLNDVFQTTLVQFVERVRGFAPNVLAMLAVLIVAPSSRERSASRSPSSCRGSASTASPSAAASRRGPPGRPHRRPSRSIALATAWVVLAVFMLLAVAALDVRVAVDLVSRASPGCPPPRGDCPPLAGGFVAGFARRSVLITAVNAGLPSARLLSSGALRPAGAVRGHGAGEVGLRPARRPHRLRHLLRRRGAGAGARFGLAGKEIARESLERLLRRRGPEDEDGLKHL